MAQLCQEFDLHVNQITDWKRQLIERAAQAFDGTGAAPAVDLVPLQAKIGAYLHWYNKDRAHSSIEDQTPEEAYHALLPVLKEAA